MNGRGGMNSTPFGANCQITTLKGSSHQNQGLRMPQMQQHCLQRQPTTMRMAMASSQTQMANKRGIAQARVDHSLSPMAWTMQMLMVT